MQEGQVEANRIIFLLLVTVLIIFDALFLIFLLTNKAIQKLKRANF